MKKFAGTAFCLLVWFACHLAAAYLNLDARHLVADVLLPFGGALTGIILATVGIVMGSLGSVFSAVESALRLRETQSKAGGLAPRADANTPTSLKQDAPTKALDHLNTMVQELKHDCLFVVIAFAIILGLYLVLEADVRGIKWPSWPCASEAITVSGAALALCVLCFIAILDTVGVVFRLHKLIQPNVQNGSSQSQESSH